MPFFHCLFSRYSLCLSAPCPFSSFSFLSQDCSPGAPCFDDTPPGTCACVGQKLSPAYDHKDQHVAFADVLGLDGSFQASLADKVNETVAQPSSGSQNLKYLNTEFQPRLPSANTSFALLRNTKEASFSSRTHGLTQSKTTKNSP